MIASQGQAHPPPFLPVIKSTTTTTHTFRICTDHTSQWLLCEAIPDKRVGGHNDIGRHIRSRDSKRPAMFLQVTRWLLIN